MDGGLLQAVSTVGFPAVVAGYLLVRTEQRLTDLAGAVERLAIICERLEARRDATSSNN